MTEAEWLAGTELDTLIQFLFFDTFYSDRKLQLFSVACCSPILPYLQHFAPQAAHILSLTELFADGLIPPTELIGPHKDLNNQWEWFFYKADISVEANVDLFGFAGAGIPAVIGATLCAEESARPDTRYRQRCFYTHWMAQPFPCRAACEAASALECAAVWSERAGAADYQRPLLFDIFGNPFRPVALDPAWRTSATVAVARQMYESRDFSMMPILADALQDGGCDDEQILAHCQGPGPHVRGCWVVDAVLNKV